ncbi:MAG: DUF192 domain-containing protein [Pseudobdellovibrio sp.]
MVLRLSWLIVLTVSVLFNANVGAKEQSAISFSKQKIQIGSKIITVEVAKTPEQHERGLMFRKSLPQDQGMLFIFEKEEPLNFWMKNTLIDLSIAYIDKNKTIVDLQEMMAYSGAEIYMKTYPSAVPAMYALEMNKNWFSTNKIKKGDKLIIDIK